MSRGFFEESGWRVGAVHSLKRPSEVLIGHATEADLRDGLKVLAAKGVDAIVQAGTDLAMADLAGEAERWLGIPVIAINVATYWSALRSNGIDDRVHGFGVAAGGTLERVFISCDCSVIARDRTAGIPDRTFGAGSGHCPFRSCAKLM